MITMEDIIRSRQKNCSVEDVAGIKSRLAFAGLEEVRTEDDVALAHKLIDQVATKMRFSKHNMEDYAEQTSTLPKQDILAASDKVLTVSLVNGRLVKFNPENNVAMPLKQELRKFI